MSRREKWLRNLIRIFAGTYTASSKKGMVIVNELKRIGICIPIGILVFGDFKWLSNILKQEFGSNES